MTRLPSSPVPPRSLASRPPIRDRYMAATSSSSSSTSPKNRHADNFRPQFPVDPFGSSTLAPKPGSSSSIPASSSEPWLLRPDQIPFSTTYRRDVVLVLGTPSARSVAALLASHSLVHSLVIFASHDQPTLPSGSVPAVRVLRLTSPLAVEDTGAVRLVSTLEWAERVARTWRAYGSDGADVVWYDEATKDTSALSPGPFSRQSARIPSGSVESLNKPSRSMRGLPDLIRRRLSTSSTSSPPPIDPSQRPFDAILNYIAHDVAEKHVLKQVILVTSITRPFLSPILSPYHKLTEAKKNGRRKRRASTHSLPPTPPYPSGDVSTRASSSTTAISVLSVSAMPPPPSHMVHIVPRTTRTGLMRNLDAFLSSFSKQATGTEEVNHAKQYILNSSTVREIINHPHFEEDGCSVLDLILLGGLDSISGKSWVGAGRDILFLPTPDPSSVPSTPVKPRKLARSPSKTLPDPPQFVDPVSPPRAHVRSSSRSSPPFSTSGSLRKTRGRLHKTADYTQPVPEQDEFTPSNLQPHSDSVQYPLQGPCQPSSLSTLSRMTTQRSKLNVITKPDDPVLPTSGLPTPPYSDEDARCTSPRTPASEVSSPQKKKFKWQFWKS